MAAAAAGGGGGCGGGEDQQQLFERLHGELVREAEDVAASFGADNAVLVVSPHSGAPRVSCFRGGGGSEELERTVGVSTEEIARMDRDEVVELEERLRLLRLLLLQRIMVQRRRRLRRRRPPVLPRRIMVVQKRRRRLRRRPIC